MISQDLFVKSTLKITRQNKKTFFLNHFKRNKPINETTKKRQ